MRVKKQKQRRGSFEQSRINGFNSHAKDSGFLTHGPKNGGGGEFKKIPLSLSPSLLLKSAPCALFVWPPGVEEKSRIRGDI